MTGYKLAFPYFHQLSDEYKEDFTFDELSFFKDCLTNCKIVFKQEPKKCATQCFDNSGYALLKGRNWNFFMQKLYCIIGRSPINYKKFNMEVKEVWHVDVDLGHLRKVSR